ncbi:hypothetical protein KKF84_16845, partial [Myxococcota bacterium]|nr:hypothetical protein [Myxococcota bacterium]MBU1536994.1 hypothetical protein [Myxococcota bacterium]
VPHGMSKQQTPLTKMGKRSAYGLGDLLHGRVSDITTSNMYSCVETALGISMGAGYTGRLRTNPEWGLPGVFVEDRERAARLLRDKGVIWTYQYMAGNPQAALPGMRSCFHGSAILVRDLHFFKIPKGEVAVYVTHDSLLSCLIAGITRRPILPRNWPAYLEGFVLWVDDWKMAVANRGICLPVSGPF